MVHTQTYIYFIYITIHFILHITMHIESRCMSCLIAAAMITGRAYCFCHNIYIMLILLLWDLSTLCALDHLWPLRFALDCWNISKRCLLCLHEKLLIFNYHNPAELLNKRSELMAKCPQENKFLLSNYEDHEVRINNLCVIIIAKLLHKGTLC